MNFDWKRYAESVVQESYDDLFSDYFVALQLHRGHKETVSAEDTLLDFARSGSFRRLLLTGRPGSGKSFLLNRLAGVLAQQLLTEIETFEFASVTNAGGPSEYQPDRRTVIPILVRLNLFNAADYQDSSNSLILETKISENLSQFGLAEPLHQFFRHDAQFVVLIDDLDEISRDNEFDNLREIRRFIERYSAHKFVLAGRESAANRFEHRFRAFKIAGLDVTAARRLIEQVATSDQDFLFEILQKAEGLLDFLSTPYFLIQCADFWNQPGEGGFNIGRALLICIDRLIARQEKTEYTPDVVRVLHRRTLILEKLALDSLQEDDKLSNQIVESVTTEDMQWFQQMEFLARNPTEVKFTSRWIQAFLAAHYLTQSEQFASSQDREEFLYQTIEKMSPTKATFLLLIRDLIDEDYTHLLSPEGDFESHFTQQYVDLYSWAFERKVEDYIRSTFGFQDTRHSYDPPYLRPNEIDIYAEKSDGKRREVWIVECKFRFPPYPKPIKGQFLEQLAKKRAAVVEYRRPRAENEGESLGVVSVLVTNGGNRCSPDLARLADQHKIQMFYVDLNPGKVFTRSKIKSHEKIIAFAKEGETQ